MTSDKMHESNVLHIEIEIHVNRLQMVQSLHVSSGLHKYAVLISRKCNADMNVVCECGCSYVIDLELILIVECRHGIIPFCVIRLH